MGFSFVWRDKNGSIFIFLHAHHQLMQHHLLKILSFFPLDVFSIFDKYQVTVGMWVHFGVFNSILLIFLPVSVPILNSFYHYSSSVVELEVRDGDAPRRSLVVEHSFCYPGFFVIPDEFVDCSFYLCVELIWDFYGDCIKSVDCLRQDGHFYCINPANL